MLIISTKYQVLKYVIMIVACLSVAEIFRELPSDQFKIPEDEVMEEDELLTT